MIKKIEQLRDEEMKFKRYATAARTNGFELESERVNTVAANEVGQIADWLEELKRYKELEERGRLVVLPEKEEREMKKATLSQPMAGKTDEEIVETREKAITALTGQGYEVVNTLFTDEWYSEKSMKERGVVQIPLSFLAKSLENMSLCHVVYFCKGWENARGCRIEHDAAVAYGLEVIYEEG